jgi:hypothetical protein
MNRAVGSAYTIPARLETYDGEPIILFELNNGKSADDAWMEQEFLRLSESELLSEPSGLVIRTASVEDAAAIAQHNKHVSIDLLA